MGESAFNDAMGAIVAFAVLAVAMGDGEFSLKSSLFELIQQSVIGIVAGTALGYLAALLIAHERWAFLSEYAPVVTLVAVIGAYFAADGLQASGFMAVFVFGIALGNKATFGFAMEAGGAQKLDEFILTTAFIMRLFIFILLRRPGRFHADGKICAQWCRRRRGPDAGGAAGDGVPVRAAGSTRALEFQRDAVDVLDPRDRRHSGCTRRTSARHQSPRRANDCVRHLHRDFDDDPDSGADHRRLGRRLGLLEEG